MSAPDQTASAGQLSLLGQRRFAALFWVQALGAFNDQVFKTGFVTLLTFRLADTMGLNVGLHSSLAAALLILPFALFAPTSGQLADGMDKARLMRWVKLAEIVLMIAAAVAFHLQNLTFLYILLFLMGTQSAVFAPIKYGVLPQYLRENELVSGNGMIQGATFMAILVGQIVGAKLVLLETGITIISIAIISIAVIGWIASHFAPPAPPLGKPPKVDWFFLRAMWSVISEGRKSPRAFKAILGVAWFWFTGATFLALLPAFVKEALHADENVFILILTTFSIGVAIGAVLCARLFGTAPKIRTAAWGAGGIAAFSILLWFAVKLYTAQAGAAVPGNLTSFATFLSVPGAWSVLGCFLFIAASCGLYVTPMNVVIQVAAPPDARARFIACSNAIDALLMASASLVAIGLLSAGLSEVGIYALVGGTGIFAALWARAQK